MQNITTPEMLQKIDNISANARLLLKVCIMITAIKKTDANEPINTMIDDLQRIIKLINYDFNSLNIRKNEADNNSEIQQAAEDVGENKSKVLDEFVPFST